MATPVIEMCSVHLNCFMGPLKQYGRYCVHCVTILFAGLSLVFPMCNLPGHEASLYCVFFRCTCEISTTRNCLFMKLINLVIFTQDQKGDPLNILSIILLSRYRVFQLLPIPCIPQCHTIYVAIYAGIRHSHGMGLEIGD